MIISFFPPISANCMDSADYSEYHTEIRLPSIGCTNVFQPFDRRMFRIFRTTIMAKESVFDKREQK
jgi:hypothetical protein